MMKKKKKKVSHLELAGIEDLNQMLWHHLKETLLKCLQLLLHTLNNSEL